MCRTTTFASVLGLVTVILTLSINTQAQTGPPVFRSPADAGRTHRYRRNLIRYNEAWAVRTVYTFVAAQAVYANTTGNGNYGTLAELGKDGLIASYLIKGRHGYVFRVRVEKYSTESPPSFEAVAVPRKYGIPGRRSFYVNETGAIVAADRKGAEAHAGDDPLDP